MNEQVRIIKHDTIPPLPGDCDGGVQHLKGIRDLSRSPEVREFIPDGAQFSPTWLALNATETLSSWNCRTPTLLVACSGSGEISCDQEYWKLGPGQIALVHPGTRLGVSPGPSGIGILKVELAPHAEGSAYAGDATRASLLNTTHAPRALDELLSYNNTRVEEFRASPLIEILTGGRLTHESVRGTYFEQRHVWLLGCQNALFARQSSCDDPKFSSEFTTDLREELALHDILASDRRRPDPALSALAGWFSYQMYVVDDVEKLALTHLVLAQANGVREIGELRAFGGDSTGAARAEDQVVARMNRRMESARAILDVQTEDALRRVQKTLAEGWDMAQAAAERLAELASRPSSSRGAGTVHPLATP